MTDFDPTTVHSAAFWDERYSEAEPVWSGAVNHRLEQEAADLRAGVALEFGSGEGGDAVWLAGRGWRVTATDVSPVVVQKARLAAERALPPDVAARITWQAADMLTWQPPAATFDLVTLHYLHPKQGDLAGLFSRIAGATRPGGTLLFVNHDPDDMRRSGHAGHAPDMALSASQVAAALAPDEWDVQVAESRDRPPVTRDGDTHHVRDVVVRATRRRS